MIETAHALRVSISKPALKALSRCVRLHKRRVEFQTHAVCDGFHVCRFLDELQDLLNK